MSEFYRKLKDITPQWLSDRLERRWQPSDKLADPFDDPMQRLAEMYAGALGETLPKDKTEMRDFLIVFGNIAARHYQEIANSYAKIANDAMNCALPPPFIIEKSRLRDDA